MGIKIIKKEAVLIILFLILINLVSASNEILLKSRHFIPTEGISDATRAKIESIHGRAHVLIQLNYIPSPEQRKELEGKGIRLLSYIPNKAWFASVPSDKSEEIASLSDVRAISEILAEDKIFLKNRIVYYFDNKAFINESIVYYVGW